MSGYKSTQYKDKLFSTVTPASHSKEIVDFQKVLVVAKKLLDESRNTTGENKDKNNAVLSQMQTTITTLDSLAKNLGNEIISSDEFRKKTKKLLDAKINDSAYLNKSNTPESERANDRTFRELFTNNLASQWETSNDGHSPFSRMMYYLFKTTCFMPTRMAHAFCFAINYLSGGTIKENISKPINQYFIGQSERFAPVTSHAKETMQNLDDAIDKIAPPSAQLTV